MGFSIFPGPIQSSDYSYIRFSVGVSGLTGATLGKLSQPNNVSKLIGPDLQFLITGPTGSTTLYVGGNLTDNYIFQPVKPKEVFIFI